MSKINAFLVALTLISLMWLSACGDKDAGNCSISCGGAGTGQQFVQTNHPFVSEGECRKMGEDRGKGCKTSFCPPTGNSNDCYQVYP
ncbi:MAG: hypothetical protein RIA63_00440 [Cyclobacteriaceae bacterium]